MSTFSNRIKALRTEHHYSLRYVADKCGISKSAVGLYENDQRKPKIEVLEAFADLYNCDIDYLLGKSDIKNAAANQLGYNSLYEAWKDDQSPSTYVDAVIKKMPPEELQLEEGDRELLDLIRLMPPEMKAMYREALRAALKSQGLI